MDEGRGRAGGEDNGGFEKMPAEPRQIFSARGREETQERLQFALERERGATKQKQLVSLIAPISYERICKRNRRPLI